MYLLPAVNPAQAIRVVVQVWAILDFTTATILGSCGWFTVGGISDGGVAMALVL